MLQSALTCSDPIGWTRWRADDDQHLRIVSGFGICDDQRISGIWG